MKIIIPMTGNGTRFVEAGYKKLKPLIEVEGKPILWWIARGMYPKEELLFICRRDHLEGIDGMERQLREIAPEAEFCVLDDWVKKGPVYDVLRAGDYIDDSEPCVINYCDFYMTWDWERMKRDLEERGCEGCIPCYTGFHPHLMIEKNLYASCLTDENDDLIEIREKYSFEKDKTKAKHSPGTYYFKTGALLKKYCKMLVDSGQEIKGEYYASMPYNFMVKDGLKVWIPTNVEYFCQWGTPEDMTDSVYWIETMKNAHGRVSG